MLELFRRFKERNAVNGSAKKNEADSKRKSRETIRLEPSIDHHKRGKEI